jgi:hypothetical protein
VDRDARAIHGSHRGYEDTVGIPHCRSPHARTHLGIPCHAQAPRIRP